MAPWPTAWRRRSRKPRRCRRLPCPGPSPRVAPHPAHFILYHFLHSSLCAARPRHKRAPSCVCSQTSGVGGPRSPQAQPPGAAPALAEPTRPGAASVCGLRALSCTGARGASCPSLRGRSGLCPGEDGAPPAPPCPHSVAAGGADTRVRPEAESALTTAVPTSQEPQQPARGRWRLPLPAPHPVSCLPWAAGVAGAPGPNGGQKRGGDAAHA